MKKTTRGDNIMNERRNGDENGCETSGN